MQGTDFWPAMSELLGRVAAGLSNFIDREIELAKLEASEDLSAFARASRLYAVAAVLAVGALAMLLAALLSALSTLYQLFGLGQSFADALAALSLAVLCGLVAWWLYAHATTIMRSVAKRLDRAFAVFARSAEPPPPPPPLEDQR